MSKLFLLGPTASGKHKVAMLVAEELNAEIISIDSMKVYRGMDIGTAKPPKEDMAKIPHHLIDTIDPSDIYSAGRFVKDAMAVVKDIEARKKLSLFVGGTALYYKALTYGIFEGVSADLSIRNELLELATEKGATYLHNELAKIDPKSASKIHPNDLRRIVRAIEVFRKTGKPISDLQTHFRLDTTIDKRNIVFCLQCDRTYLHKRIKERVEKMFAEGLIDEVRQLMARKDGWSREARSAVGYREIIDYLNGLGTPEDAKQKIITNTNSFARRQMTWFRSFKEARRLDVKEGDTPQKTADEIISVFKQIE